MRVESGPVADSLAGPNMQEYFVFVASLLATALDAALGPAIPIAGAVFVALAFAVRHAVSKLLRSPDGQESLLPGWPVHRLWALGVALSAVVAIADALLGSRVILIGLIVVGPCCVLLTGRWIQTAITAVWAVGLVVLLGLPDGIWGTGMHLAFLAAVATAALANTVAAAITDRRRSWPDRSRRVGPGQQVRPAREQPHTGTCGRSCFAVTLLAAAHCQRCRIARA